MWWWPRIPGVHSGTAGEINQSMRGGVLYVHSSCSCAAGVVCAVAVRAARKQAALLYETQHLGSIALFGERVGLPEAKDGFCS